MAFATQSNARWPRGRIPYEISNDFSAGQLRSVEAAIWHWNRHTIMRLEPKAAADIAFALFEPVEGSCSSSVGMTGGSQGIRCDVGDGFTKGNIIHEIGHAVGYLHEQQRPDRDLYVTIDTDNIRDRNPDEPFDPADQYATRTGVLLTEYDLGSIMHYPRSGSFAVDPGKDIITPLDPDAEIGQRDRLSDLDILGVCELYGAPHMSVAWQSGEVDPLFDVWFAGVATWGKYCVPPTMLHRRKGDQRHPAVAVDADRISYVAWVHDSSGDGSSKISLRAIRPDGRNQFGTRSISADGADSNESPDIAAGDNGDTVVAWVEHRPDGRRVRARGFQRDGSSRFPGQTLAPGTDGSAGRVRVEMRGDGGFVVVWGVLDDNDSLHVRARVFDLAGLAESPEIAVADGLGDIDVIPSVAVSPMGEFVVVWDDQLRAVHAKGFDRSGAERFARITIAAHEEGRANFADVAAHPDGGFVVVWTDDRNANRLGQIRARRFAGDGSSIGRAFTVNRRGGGDQREPRITMAFDGSFTVVWQDDRHRDGFYQVHTQTMGPDRELIEGPRTINPPEAIDSGWHAQQLHPAIAGP